MPAAEREAKVRLVNGAQPCLDFFPSRNKPQRSSDASWPMPTRQAVAMHAPVALLWGEK